MLACDEQLSISNHLSVVLVSAIVLVVKAFKKALGISFFQMINYTEHTLDSSKSIKPDLFYQIQACML